MQVTITCSPEASEELDFQLPYLLTQDEAVKGCGGYLFKSDSEGVGLLGHL